MINVSCPVVVRHRAFRQAGLWRGAAVQYCQDRSLKFTVTCESRSVHHCRRSAALVSNTIRAPGSAGRRAAGAPRHRLFLVRAQSDQAAEQPPTGVGVGRMAKDAAPKAKPAAKEAVAKKAAPKAEAAAAAAPGDAGAEKKKRNNNPGVRQQVRGVPLSCREPQRGAPCSPMHRPPPPAPAGRPHLRQRKRHDLPPGGRLEGSRRPGRPLIRREPAPSAYLHVVVL